MVNLLDTRGQLDLRTAIDDRCLSTQTLCRTHRVHCHVTATDNHRTTTCIDRCVVLSVVGVHQVRARQELIGRNHTIQILALDAHKARQTRTRADKHRIIALLIEQRIDRNGATRDGIGLEHNAQTTQRVDLTCHDTLLGQTELGNTINQHTAHLVQSLENTHFVAQFGQVARTSQTRRTTTDDRHTMTVRLGALLVLTTIFDLPVAYETFELADGNRLTLNT